MIIECPNCFANYKAGDKVIGQYGQKFRCGNCGYLWVHPSHGNLASREGRNLTMIVMTILIINIMAAFFLLDRQWISGIPFVRSLPGISMLTDDSESGKYDETDE